MSGFDTITATAIRRAERAISKPSWHRLRHLVHSPHMNPIRCAFFLLLTLVFVSPNASGAAADGEWQIDAHDDKGVEFDPRTGRMTAKNGVTVSYTPPNGIKAELSANSVSLDQPSGEIEAEGRVFLRNGSQSWKGGKLKYNFKTGVLDSGEFRTAYAPFYAGGLSLSADTETQTYVATNAFVTPDDLAEPVYTIRCKSLKVVPGKRITAKHATAYLGKVPVWYLPVWTRSLERHRNYWVTTPGYRSIYGPYLLTKYVWNPTEKLEASIAMDYRQRRGVGIGPEIKLELGRWGKIGAGGYITRDDDPDINSGGRTLGSERHRIDFTYRADIRTNMTVKARLREQSDPFIIRDFFEWEYRNNTQPNSFVEFEYLWDNFSLSALAMPRVNDFFERVERLPDVKFTGLRQQLGNTPLYYEGESTAGYFKHEFRDNNQPSFAAWRVDTYHQVILPKTFFNWLNFTPRVGGRFTAYGETEGGFAGPESERWVINTGAELSTKLSRTWGERKLRLFNSVGMRHIIEPTLNYVFVPSPNVTPGELPQFDSIIPTLRLLPIDFPEFNAIDSVDSQNTVRLGLRNQIQTKRDGRVDTLVNWQLFTDWRLRQRPDQETYSDLYSDLDFKPRKWLTLSSENRYDLNSGVFRIADHRVTYTQSDRWTFALGHRYIRRTPSVDPIGQNLILANLYYRLNENWAFNIREQFESRDGTLEEQNYSIYRDFRSWVGSLTVRLRNSRQQTDDFTIAFTLSLKAFPRFDVGTDSNEPSYLIGNR
jgi:LPS-assembly protein